MVPPLPSHTNCWQSPAICAGAAVVAVPAGVLTIVHLPATQPRCWQSSSTPGHLLTVASVHSTQAGLVGSPLHTCPPAVLQGESGARAGFEGTPLPSQSSSSQSVGVEGTSLTSTKSTSTPLMQTRW